MSDLHNVLKEKYTEFLLLVSSNEEDETKKYDIENFVETQSDSINFIELFLNNFFLHTHEILEQNIDFFATQKKYVLITKKGKQMKKRNPRRSYLFGREDEQLFYQYLVKNKKIQYKQGAKYLEILGVILNSLVYKEEKSGKYVFHQEFLECYENHENKDKYQILVDNIDNILKTFEENDEESIEVEDLEEEDNDSKDSNEDETPSGQQEMPNMPGMPGMDFLKNSKIGQLAEKISKNIDVENLDQENPADLMKALFSGEGNNKGIQNIVSQVFSQVQETMADENSGFNENDLANEAQSFLGSMGKNMGGMGGLGNIAEVFGNMNDFEDGGSVPKTSKKGKKKGKKRK